MILRRFMKHVSEQNWFAVGLDVLVVITGIFLGMQVTEWNEGRKEEQQRLDFLARVHEDMKVQVGIFRDYRSTTFEAMMSDTVFVQEAIETGHLASDDRDQFERGMIQLLMASRVSVNALEEAMAVRLQDNLVSDARLSKLLSVYLSLNDYTAIIYDTANENLLAARPVLNKYLSIKQTEARRFPTELNARSLIIDFEELVADPEAVHALRNLIALTLDGRSSFLRWSEKGIELFDHIEMYLEAHGREVRP